MANSTNFAAGSTLRCTVTKTPNSHGAQTTLERLMRLDPKIRKGLKRAHTKRQQSLEVYIRGNRDWTKREPCGKLVKAEKGQSWSMTFDPTLAPDLASVAGFVKIEQSK